MSSRAPSRVVFVGNIPYGLSEEQISDIFSRAGQVLNFRLVYDRETGKPKGFGFAEFPDADSASSAVRNLNDYEVMGRKLRVDFSNEGGSDEDKNDRGSANNAGMHSQSNAGVSAVSLPPLPPGKDLPPGISCTDQISSTLKTLPPEQLLDVLQQMKYLATADQARAIELLSQAPQLSYAIFQALLIMGLVSPDAITSVLENGGGPSAATVPIPFTFSAGVPAAAAAGYAPQPAAAPPVGAPAAQDSDQLIRAVLELPQETIDQLPEAERQQIMALRAIHGQRR